MICQTVLIETRTHYRLRWHYVCASYGEPPSFWKRRAVEKSVTKEERDPWGSSSHVQAVVWSVCWLPGCTEDAAGQGGERQVNYYTERERRDALHSPLWPAVLGFKHREVSAKDAGEGGKGWPCTGHPKIATHRSLMTGAVSPVWKTWHDVLTHTVAAQVPEN